jgi:sporulation-control protein spo0M
MELVEDNFYQDQFLLMIWSLGEKYTIGIKERRSTPEVQSIFMTHPVGMGNE